MLHNIDEFFGLIEEPNSKLQLEFFSFDEPNTRTVLIYFQEPEPEVERKSQ
jgi:hypothetical protein